MIRSEVPLKRLVDPYRPITYGIVQAGPDTPGGTPYIRPADMTPNAGVLDPESLLRTTLTIADSYRRSTIRDGDLVVSIGPSFGKVMIVPPALAGANLTQGTARVAPGPNVEARFLYWALQSAIAVKFWESSVGGATFRALNLEPLSRTPVALMDLGEQRRIADFLDSEVSRLDELSALRLKQLATLSEYLLCAVSSIADGARDVPMVRLGYLAKVQSGITVDSSRDLSGDVVRRPYLRVANVQEGFVALDSVTEVTVPRQMAAVSTLRPGDVLMTEGGDLDKLGRGTVWRGELFDCLHQNHVFAVRPDPRKLDPDYLALLTRSTHARSHFESTGVRTTNLASTSSSKIRDLRVPLVDLEEQRVTVRRINAEVEKIAALRRALTDQLSLISERRQAMVTVAVTGQLDVSTARGADLS
ncbi:hypothetical protein Cme02nite_55640 [Catellatospora methionotrophica]|uniref:Type I restriction modification DNA specificity domain-containing protein n=1 Tax=Catellatospora methionotrophica TaxID=121620 RepID=A0A8J3LA96_9ACTN|nr:restriction endonuclease subunit S [Catellatospora methionotrophica]GIG17232.1 hypothetical protein Cme02nite_55640 [Catellatospora methionotrophica]